ncbi:hypothetical protein Q1695_005774 [Nippostrongylus brasiliensis]|nr:hypothetical protein Q1695_005774 [Nippostrongylus brasiliensis]
MPKEAGRIVVLQHRQQTNLQTLLRGHIGKIRTLDGVPFTTDPQDNVYCVTCYQDKFAPRCAVCNKPIVPKDGEKESVRVIAMDKSFHPSCYKCEDCGMQLSSKVEGAACYPLNSHLNCKTCNGNRLRAQAAA